MKILMLIDALDVGGAETHVITLANTLSQQGAAVSVLSAGGCLEEQLLPGVERLHFSGTVCSASGWLRGCLALRRLLRERHFDVLHAHTRRCALMLRFAPRGAPRAALPHPQMEKTYRPAGLRAALRPLRVVSAHAVFRPRPRRMCYWGDVTIAVSDDIRRHLRQAFGGELRRRPIHVVGNGIELAPCTRLPTGKDAFVVAFASRLDEDCSLAAESLLRIAPALAALAQAHHRTLRLWVLGGGERYAALQKMRDGMLRRGVIARDTVRFFGKVAQPREYLARAHAFVGVSRCALEALSCGVPVVLAGNEGYGGRLTPDNFDHFSTGNFCCRGEGALCDAALLDALHKLLDCDPRVLQREAEVLMLRLKQQYDIRSIAQKTLRLYVAALRERRVLRVACAGYYGKDNLGDQALLRCLARRFEGAEAPPCLSDAPWGARHQGRLCHPRCRRKRGALYTPRRRLWRNGRSHTPMRRPSKASDDIPLRLRLEVITAADERACEGLVAIPRRRVGQLLAALRRCDALLLGGGSLLQNASRHGRRSLLYYLGLLCVARALGCPFSLRANGVGPLRGGVWKYLTGRVLRRAAGISLRDERSLVVLCACGLPRERLSPCEDGVLWWVRRQRRVQPGEPPYVCVCPRAAEEQDFAALPCLLREYSQRARLVWVALGGARDEAVCRALAARMGGEVTVLRQEMAALQLLGGAGAVISMRYHALILGCGGSGRLIALPTRATRDKMTADFEKYRQ